MTTHAIRSRPAKHSDVAPVKRTMRDVMTPQPHTIGRDQTLDVAHRKMLKHDIRHLPVLDDGRLVGMLTQRDLYFLETIAGVDMTNDIVEDAMTPDTYRVDPSESVDHVAAVMCERKLGSAVVVEDGQVTGIFTVTDALRLLAANSK